MTKKWNHKKQSVRTRVSRSLKSSLANFREHEPCPYWNIGVVNMVDWGRREPGLDALLPQWQAQMQWCNTTTALPRLSNSHCSPPFLHSWERLGFKLYAGFLGRCDPCSALYIVEVIVISVTMSNFGKTCLCEIGYILVRSINSPARSRHEEQGIFTSVHEQIKATLTDLPWLHIWCA